MKSFTQYLKEAMGNFKADADYEPEAKLGPKATKARDKVEIVRQKKHLDIKAKEYHDMSKDENGGGMAKAHGDMFANAKKAIHSEEVVNEDGMGGMVAAPTNAAGAGVAGTGDSRLPGTQREPGVSKKRNPILQKLARRALPKV